MKRLLLCLSFLVVLLAVPALAENTTLMNVHVEKAVAIPGNVLQPGDYTFRIVTLGGSSYVAIASADSTTNYGFVQTFRTHRNSGYENEIRSIKTDNSGLGRIDSWYFPGQSDGFSFIYSKSDLAKVNMIAQQMKARTDQSGQ